MRCYLGKLRVSKERWYLGDGSFKCSGKMRKSNLFLLYEVVVCNGIRVTGELSHSLRVSECSNGATMLGPALLQIWLCLALSCSGQAFLSMEKPNMGRSEEPALPLC